jgi:phosphatidylserine decarboxylase
MRMDRAGWPFVALAAAPAAVVALFGRPAIALGLLVAPLLVAAFFRDPRRLAPQDASLVLAPADGRVMFAGDAKADEAPTGGPWRQVTIFLSPLDVHINWTPAYKREAARNERSEIWVDHDGTAIVARQVVGVLARRVVCRLRVGDVLSAGDRIGLMKFGSRMDVFLPPSAALTVGVGQRVRGADTVIARLASGRIEG